MCCFWSRYGITTVFLRGAQVGALILGNALMMCAVKGVASVTLILSVFVLMVLACGAACATCGTGKWYGKIGGVCAAFTDVSHCMWVLFLALLFFTLGHVDNDYNRDLDPIPGDGLGDSYLLRAT